MERTLEKPWSLAIRATLIAGTLDMLSAATYALVAGKNPLAVPVGIASAAWPGALKAGPAALIVGLLLHFAIMFVMVAVYVAAARRTAWLTARPITSGVLYGLVLWAVMNLIVLPLRWPALFPHFTATTFAEQIFSHVVLVGVPLAWMTSRSIQILGDAAGTTAAD
ncbi:hypothetical protein [Dyella silvae]|uniref:hypothetical protein n=1 Tax=Dyella silvae TaxID=2994424 RepID=UPI00226484FC|nr:hypothetical protein [Dyella silvae]